MKYKAIFDIPDGYKIGCAVAKICPNDGKIRKDSDFENAYAATIPYDDDKEQSAEEYCLECDHIEMCRWYPFEGCVFRSIKNEKN